MADNMPALRGGHILSMEDILAPKAIDLTGQTFDLLTVIGQAEKQGRNYMWHCVCKCGNKHKASTNNLRRGSVRSCGCLRKKGKHGERPLNGTTSVEYMAWMRMYPRPAYWDEFTEFLKDIGRRPTANHTLSKKDYRLPHGKENTAWVDRAFERARAAEEERTIVIDLR